MVQDLIVINIIGCAVAVIGTLLSIGWSRAIRGALPSRGTMRLLALVFLVIWALGDVFYFYLRWRG